MPLALFLGAANAADISNMTVQSNNHSSDMPSGSKCGDYVMSGNKTRVNVYCMGQSVRNGCPKGFTHRNFGYFEAGGGERKYVWCTKN